MRFYGKDNVFNKTIERITYLYKEFGDLYINHSTGKDSTVTMEMALIVAKKLGKLPLKVVWLDQEYEFTESQKYAERLRERKEIDFRWYQIPSTLGNAFQTGICEEGFAGLEKCWWEGQEWVRKKNEGTIRDNHFGTFRFKELLEKIQVVDLGGLPCLVGMRGEESLQRLLGMTGSLAYKNITWGAKNKFQKGVYRFFPLYDWLYTDIFKTISENNWDYNRIYDKYYMLGMNPRNFRVSSIIHEQSFRAIFLLQMTDRELYDKMSKKLGGISTGKNLGFSNIVNMDLPSIFRNWEEFFWYLMTHSKEMGITESFKGFLISKIRYFLEYLYVIYLVMGEKKISFTKNELMDILKEKKEKIFRDFSRSILLNDFELYKLQNTITPTIEWLKSFSKRYYGYFDKISTDILTKEDKIKSLYFLQ